MDNVHNLWVLENKFGVFIILLHVATEFNLIIPRQLPLEILESVEYDPDLSNDHKPDFGPVVGKYLLEHRRMVVIDRFLCVLLNGRVLELTDNCFELDDLVLLQSSLYIHKF